jgi:hypothetical protein
MAVAAMMQAVRSRRLLNIAAPFRPDRGCCRAGILWHNRAAYFSCSAALRATWRRIPARRPSVPSTRPLGVSHNAVECRLACGQGRTDALDATFLPCARPGSAKPVRSVLR